MSQVIIEFGRNCPSSSGTDSPVYHFTGTAEEIASTGSSQETTASTTEDAMTSVITVHNNGDDTIWVAFGEDAAVETGKLIRPNTSRDFGGMDAGTTVSVVNDS